LENTKAATAAFVFCRVEVAMQFNDF